MDTGSQELPDVNNEIQRFIVAESSTALEMKQNKDKLPPEEYAKTAPIEEIKEKFPDAVRTTNNPHLYRVMLQCYGRILGLSAAQIDHDNGHEMDHFKGYIAAPSAINNPRPYGRGF